MSSGECHDLCDFFQELTARTKSKLIMTSRVDTRAGQQQRVHGFSPHSHEAIKLVDSRLRLLGMSPESLSPDQKQSVIRTTDGIPLFVEDLLRYFRLTHELHRTLEAWRTKEGHSAREFALRSEFDSLGDISKTVLLSCCLLETQVTIDDLQAVTGYGVQDITTAMLELQGLFLVSPPTEANEYRTFAVSVNTAQLVKQELANRSEFRRVEDAVKSISGAIYRNQLAGQYVNAAFKKAYWYVRSERFSEAENVIRETLNRPGLSEHSELHGSLGWIYKQWQPIRRSGDARTHFQRAASLKSRKVDMYWHWAELELDEQNWNEVIEAGKQGLLLQDIGLHEKMRLANAVAFAMSQLGKRLAREVQIARSIQTLREADAIFREHICDPALVPPRYWRVHGKLYSGLVQNDEAVFRVTAEPRWRARMLDDLAKWESEHGDDPKLQSESTRIYHTYRDDIP